MRRGSWALAAAAGAALAAAPAWARPTGPYGSAWLDVQAQLAAAKGDMLNAPQAALVSARSAEALALRRPASGDRTRALAAAGWLEGEALVRTNRPAEATPVIDAALARSAATAPDSKLQGDLLKARGSAEAAQGRVQPALADYQAAFRVFQHAGAARSEALVLQEIGRIYSDALDYLHAISYYQQSTELLHDEPAVRLTVLNNLGYAYLGLHRDADARRAFAEAVQLARGSDSRLMRLRVLPNLALADMRTGREAEAQAALAEALRLSRDDPAARSWEVFVWDAAAQLALRRGDLPAARDAVERAFAGGEPAADETRFAEAHATAWRVYAALHEPAKALEHLTAYKRLDDEERDLAASTNAALMGAQFDFANQNLRIERLRREELQRDIAAARARARAQQTLLATVTGAGGLVLALVLAGLVAMRRSRDAVRAANRELASSNAALEHALKAKSQFLATTSHEIRTPLNGVLGMTQVLLADRSLPPGVRSRVELVHGAGETMRALVDDLLDLAKMETGRITVDRRPMDLGKLLGEAARLWRAQAQGKGLDLDLDAADAPAWIVEDAARLRQVLFNLLANAVKFTDAGGVVLRVRTGEGRLRFAVADTGVGLAAEDLERVFEPFTQVDGGTTRRHGGTGLGLAICRDVARALGGDVRVESRLGEGSEFSLDLPLTAADAPSATARAPRPGALSDARVLVVEPNPLARAVLRSVLAPATAQVEAVADAASAAARLTEGGFEHVLAAGEALAAEPEGPVEACRRLADAAGPAGLTLLLTGAAAEDAAALAAAGAVRTLHRPVAPERLLAALRGAAAARPADVDADAAADVLAA